MDPRSFSASGKSARIRMASYVLTAILLAGLYMIVSPTDWRGNADLHIAMEALAMALAITVGLMTLTRYHAGNNDVLKLVLGAGYIGTGLMDGFHTIAATSLLTVVPPWGHDLLVAWSGASSQIFLAVMTVLSLAAWKRSRNLIDSHGISPVLVYTSTLVMVIICSLYLSYIPLPPTSINELSIRRPEEFLPGAIFVLALIGFMKKADWHQDTFEHWLVLSLLVNIAVQCLFMPFSSEVYDARFNVAHLLRNVAFLCVLSGLLLTKKSDASKKHDTSVYLHSRTGKFTRTNNFKHLFRIISESLYPGIVGKRLLLLIGFLGMFIIASMILSQQANETRDRTRSMLESLDVLATAKKLAVQEKLNDYRVILRVISSRTQLRNKLVESQSQSISAQQYDEAVARMDQILNDAIDSDHMIRNISLHALDGHEIVSSGDLWLAEVDAETIEIPQSEVLSDMRNVGGSKVIQVKGPLYYENELVGGIQIWLDAHSLAVTLGGVQTLGKTADAVMAFRRPTGQLSLLRSLNELPHTESHLQDENIELGNFPMQHALSGEEGVYESGMVDYSGEPILAAIRYIPEAGIGLVVKISKAEITQDVYESLRQSLLLGGIVLAIALLLGWLAGFLLIAPLHRITKFARNFSHEVNRPDWNRQLHINTDDEFGVLASTLVRAARDMRQRQNSLTSIEKRMHAVLDNMLDAVFVIDSAGTIQYCNRSSEVILGYAPNELVNHNINILMPEPHRSMHDDYLRNYMATGEARIIGIGREVNACHKQGHEVPVSLAISRIEVDGEVLFAGILHDLTVAKQYENKLRRQNLELSAANEELEQFAYVASHDLKTPLRAIDNLVEWIMDDMKGMQLPEAVEHNLERLRERSHFMEKMIKELLAFSRAGRFAYPSEPVDVKALVEQITFELAPPESMRIAIDDSLPTMTTPKPPLELVLRNLISNAIKHHDREQGTIRVSAAASNDIYIFSITDDGPGIDPRYHKKVFQIFQTLQPKSKSNSTGMGLALVKRVVEGYGCKVDLISEADSRGCEIRFGWPMHWGEELTRPENDTPARSIKQDAA